MKKKKFTLMGMAVLSAVALASCTPESGSTSSLEASSTVVPSETSTVVPSETSSETQTSTSTQQSESRGRLDISVTYSTTEGITLQKLSQFNNIVEGKTYVKGNLLPTWTAFAAKTNTTIYDAATYATKDDATYSAVKANGFKSETDNSQMIDLLFFKTGAINTAGKGGEMVDLVQYMNAGKMPNFSAWLANEPAIENQLKQANGAIYYTPYFDGYNDVERMLNMDTKLVRIILDDDTKGDTQGTNGGANPGANLVQKGAYEPFINANYNYGDDDLELQVVNADKTGSTDIEVAQVENIIKQQNALLTTGCTGKQLADQFRAYIDDAFGDHIGAGKLYESRSDIFCSASAAYNVDELIALMRVIKANPETITGDKNNEVECLIPRGMTNNRIDNIMDFAQVWGVQGLTAEKDMLYFSPDVKLSDAATTKQTYDVLTQLGNIYAEGLIIDQFWAAPAAGKGSTEYLDKYWKKKGSDAGYALIMYDYSATQSAANDKKDGTGIGMNDSERGIEYKSDGIMPILPPITWWNSEEDWTRNDSLTDFTNKTLMRYSEENRALKDSSWAIPTTSDNKDGAVFLMDYLFSLEGSLIQDFGPEAYWAHDNNGEYIHANLVAEEQYDPLLSAQTLDMLSASGYDFWTFMRDILGATHGIGSVRSKTLQIVACNSYSQIGAANLAAGISTGVVKQGLVSNTYSWACTVPTTYENSPSQDASVTYDNLTNFWKSDKVGNPNGWVKVITSIADGSLNDNTVVCKVGETDVTWSQITSASVWAVKDKAYLYVLANSLGDTYVPDYCK